VLVPVAVKVVNLPVAAVVAPIGVLSMLEADVAPSVVVLLLAKVVKAPVPLVVAPIFILSIVPTAAGPIVTTPVPDGLKTTFALAGLSVTAALAVIVVAINGPPSSLITI
jgi:hypothetical protein